MFVTKFLAFIFVVQSFEVITSAEKALIFKDVQCEISEKLVESNYSCNVDNHGSGSTLTLVLILKKPMKEMNVSILQFLKKSLLNFPLVVV
jgi:hypothetical protein